jgi:hypothetical protein
MQILVNLLALGLVGGAAVACSSGSSSNPAPAPAPAAPAASQLAPPDGSALSEGTSGAAINLGQNQIALPGTSAYLLTPWMQL